MQRMDRPGRNERCHCNSGKKYKKCCWSLDEGRGERSREASTCRSLKEKNIVLINGMSEIFGLDRPWMKVRDGMTNVQIRESYRYVADSGRSVRTFWRCFQVLILVCDTISARERTSNADNVFRFCLYADQIIIVNPFDNPNLMADKFNPVIHPEEWRIQTLRLVFHLMLLAPWIEAGLVVLIPDRGDFNRSCASILRI